MNLYIHLSVSETLHPDTESDKASGLRNSYLQVTHNQLTYSEGSKT